MAPAIGTAQRSSDGCSAARQALDRSAFQEKRLVRRAEILQPIPADWRVPAHFLRSSGSAKDFPRAADEERGAGYRSPCPKQDGPEKSGPDRVRRNGPGETNRPGKDCQ